MTNICNNKKLIERTSNTFYVCNCHIILTAFSRFVSAIWLGGDNLFNSNPDIFYVRFISIKVIIVVISLGYYDQMINFISIQLHFWLFVKILCLNVFTKKDAFYLLLIYGCLELARAWKRFWLQLLTSVLRVYGNRLCYWLWRWNSQIGHLHYHSRGIFHPT